MGRLNISVEALLESQNSHREGIFLGGTCNDSQWRESLIPLLTKPYFNPIVEVYSEESQQQEQLYKEQAAVNLYVITPKQTGFYSFAEMMANAIKDPKRTVIGILNEDGDQSWDDNQLKSIEAIKRLVEAESAVSVLDSLESIASECNSRG